MVVQGGRVERTKEEARKHQPSMNEWKRRSRRFTIVQDHAGVLWSAVLRRIVRALRLQASGAGLSP